MKRNNLNLYLTWRNHMHTGDTILWQSQTVLGWLIQKFTKSHINHAAQVIRFDQYDTERVYVTEALSRGIELNALSNRLRFHKGYAWWLPLKPKYDQHRNAIARWSINQVGKKILYDYSSLFANMFKHVSADARRQFCSEHDFLSKKSAGIPELQTIIKAPRPCDLVDLPIYEQPVKIL